MCQDGKRPDGTIILYTGSVAWDVKVPDRYADAHVANSTTQAVNNNNNNYYYNYNSHIPF